MSEPDLKELESYKKAHPQPEDNDKHDYGLSDDQIDEIRDALDDGQPEAVDVLLEDLDAPDTADLLEKVDKDERQKLISLFSEKFDADVFSELQADVRKDLLESLASDMVASYISELESDDALDLIENLDPVFQKQIIRKLTGRDRAELEEGLTFPEDSAGRLMQRKFIAVPEFWTVGKTIDYLRSAGDSIPSEFSDIFVISPTYHVTGEIPLSAILKAKRAEKIQDLVQDEVHLIQANMDQEDVAFMFKREGLTSAPVVDENERLIGVITFDDILYVIEEEAEEDILRMGGIEKGDIYSAVLDTTKSRFSWLAVNLLTAILASIVISFFEATIEQVVALAVLFPIVASMGGNAGTQTLTVTVRALATKELSRANAARMISKELLVGFLNGLIFAVIVGTIAWLWFSSPVLGGVIAAAMIINMITAGFFGISIPILLDRMNIDPALASTVFLTTMTDIIGFLAFLGLAAAVLL